MNVLANCVLLLMLIFETQAQDPPKESVNDWYANYYQKPAPEKFVEMVRARVAAGGFKKAKTPLPMIGFYSQIMAKNPDKIGPWLDELGDLEENDRKVLLMAAWFSD